MLNKYSTRVLALLMFYENRKTTIIKVLGSIIYCITESYICVDYLCLHQAQIYLEHKGFENTIYNDFSGISIKLLLINIMSCNGFVKNKNSTVILSFQRKLVPYYL